MTLIEMLRIYHEIIRNRGRAAANDSLTEMGVDEAVKKAIADSFNDAGDTLNGFGEVESYTLFF